MEHCIKNVVFKPKIAFPILKNPAYIKGTTGNRKDRDMQETINLIVDYKDIGGHYFHRSYQVKGANDTVEAASHVMDTLRREGFVPCAIAEVLGICTIEELEKKAKTQAKPGEGRLIWIDPTEY